MGKEQIVCDFDQMEGDMLTGSITKVSSGKTNENQPDKTYITLVMDVDVFEKPYELYIPYSSKKESVWGKFIAALKEIDCNIKKPEDLEGETFKFERKDVILRGGFVAKTGFPMPVEHITDE